MQNVEIAKKLFLWNSKNLVKNADLKKSEIGDYFANFFQVKANGRSYEANHDNYLDFLNQFRSTIHSINYTLHDMILDKDHVVIPMTAHIVRLEGSLEDFEAILILTFNQAHKIVLWHEVYVKL